MLPDYMHQNTDENSKSYAVPCVDRKINITVQHCDLFQTLAIPIKALKRLGHLTSNHKLRVKGAATPAYETAPIHSCAESLAASLGT